MRARFGQMEIGTRAGSFWRTQLGSRGDWLLPTPPAALAHFYFSLFLKLISGLSICRALRH